MTRQVGGGGEVEERGHPHMQRWGNYNMQRSLVQDSIEGIYNTSCAFCWLVCITLIGKIRDGLCAVLH